MVSFINKKFRGLLAHVYDGENASKDPVLYYESNDDSDKAFTICAHYKHGFMFNSPERKFVEVTHPSDESISILFRSSTCSEVHKLAEPIGFTTEQEYIDLISTAGAWMKELFDGDSDANTKYALELNIGYDEASNNFTKLKNPSGIDEFYVPGLAENLPLIRSSDSTAYKLEKMNIDKQTLIPQSVHPETNNNIADICILRAKSGWKNAMNIQIKLIKSEINAFSCM